MVNIINWFPSVLEYRNSKIKVLASSVSGESWLLYGLLSSYYNSQVEGARELSRALIPLWVLCSHNLITHKAPHVHTITLGFRFQHIIFWGGGVAQGVGGTNILTIAIAKQRILLLQLFCLCGRIMTDIVNISFGKMEPSSLEAKIQETLAGA